MKKTHLLIMALLLALSSCSMAEGVKLDFTWQDGRAQFSLPELAIHSTIVVK